MKRWEQRIDEARQRKLLGMLSCPRFTGEDRELASRWTTCAVGEARLRYGVKMDRALGILGVKFYRAVLWNRVDRAAQLHERIEDYALECKGRAWEQEQEGRVRDHERIEGVATQAA
ncbi:MAG TPA: hypothetical protein VGW35_20700 [Methylomirabilota bacterium]|jgi:hypothetical protein|nr:hypothetical protein [Methylomirabilota bacterium]